jgi:uncharacterized repeat protein (TIGR03803 family)
MQHSRRPAIHRFKVSGALLVGVLLVTAVIGTLLAQFQGTSPGTATEVVLYGFKGLSHGAHPSGVVRDSAGTLYGTTARGGTPDGGAVYKLDATGHETLLYSFSFGNGEYPQPGVIGDSAGNLYGTTSFGGTTTCNGGSTCGVVYKLDVTGHETVLHSFGGVFSTDGAVPNGNLIRDSAGNLYGTTQQGSTSTTYTCTFGCGVVYRLDPTGHETVLYSFMGRADGGNPQAGVIRDSAGNLYGTTMWGGIETGACPSYGCGVVFKLDTAGHETVLYSFQGGPDGSFPQAGVIGDGAGNLYGTTFAGGGTGKGTVYKLDATGHETVLYSFAGGADGGSPASPLIRDPAGNLYGTAGGGATGHGVVYKVDPAGHETVLYNFTGGADGDGPSSGLIPDSAGDVYGTTFDGGAAGLGVVYKLDAIGHETVLYSFPGASDGNSPHAGVIGDGAGNLYGTTAYGGTVAQSCGPSAVAGCGVVFKLAPTGHETVLHSFTGGTDGGVPQAGLSRDSAGNLYGNTSYGGIATGVCAPYGCGVIFRLAPTERETLLYSFTGGSDGANPGGGLIGDLAGNLYGAAGNGGITTGVCMPAGCGVVFKLDPAGHETVLYTFAGQPDGSNPWGGVIRDSAGNLYGTTQNGGASGGGGTVFKLDPTGHETVLYSFTGGASDGGNPQGVIRDSAGNLYGTTPRGLIGCSPILGCFYTGGTVFKVDPSGHMTVLHAFTGGADGGIPQAGVIRDLAGNLYGTAGNAGPVGGGVVFKLDPTGRYTVVWGFGGSDGSGPSGSLILDSAGNLYGTTVNGGPANAGVVYRIKP